jgi:hypothetical protein
MPSTTWLPPLPSPQINQSLTLDPDGTTDLPAGQYRFKLKTNDKTTEIDFSIDYLGVIPQDNNSILTRLALAIEGASNNLRAEVYNGEAADSDDQLAWGTTLIVTNRETGRDESFSLIDVEGDLIARLNLNRPSRPAGERSGTEVNQFSLDKTRLVTQARQSFSDPATLLVTPARNQVISQVALVALAHNNFMNALVSAEDYLKPTVGESLAEELWLYSRQYAEVGIKVNTTGRLSLNSNFADSLDGEVPLVRERLESNNGLLPLLRSHMDSALAGGLEQSRIRRPGRVYNSAAMSSPGFDPFSRAAINRQSLFNFRV